MRLKDTEEKEELEMDQEERERLEQLRLKRKRRERNVYLLVILGCIAGMLLFMVLGMLLYRMSHEEGDALPANAGGETVTYTQQELEEKIAQAADAAKTEGAREVLGGIEEKLSNGETMVRALRPYYPEDLVVVSGGRFHFLPIREDLKKHNRLQENLTVLETGEFQYSENGQVVSHKGIDVSYHQGVIDWQQVAADGVEFAFIRVGIRGYGTGEIVADEQFENNITGALSNGIKAGVYFFSQAVTQEEAAEEAAFVLEQIAPYKIECPVVFDVEKVADSSARMNQISVEERTNLTLTFCQAIEAAGYTPMIYHNMEMGALMLDMETLEEYDKWFAYYGSDMYYPYNYRVWQYSEKGKVAGINGNVDLNISFRMWGE